MRLLRLCGEDGRPKVGAVHDGSSMVVAFEAPDVLSAIAAGERDGGELCELTDVERLELPQPWRLLLPLDPAEVWAAGVTYERSRDARLEESQTEARDAYSLVYEADRPELFLKDAGGRRTVGPGGTIGVRSDAAWTVPEPELALVLGDGGELVGATVGNDVSSRDIEGANPLYLPQAKLFAGACALGPAVLVPESWEEPFGIELRVWDAGGELVFEGETSTARMRRSFEELARYLVRDNPVPAGSVLLTGTGVVPPDELTLEPGGRVDVHIPGIGTLSNTVGLAADLIQGRRPAHVGA